MKKSSKGALLALLFAAALAAAGMLCSCAHTPPAYGAASSSQTFSEPSSGDGVPSEDEAGDGAGGLVNGGNYEQQH